VLPELSTIKLRRKLLGLSQRKLAELSGVSQGAIAKIEAGKVKPGYTIAKRIFDALEEMGTGEERKAGEIANRVEAVEPGETVERALSLMIKKGFSQVPVMENGKPVGRITEKILLDTPDKGATCEEVMGPPFVTVPESTPLKIVKEILKLDDAVLVSRRGQVVGITTKSDLLKR